MSRPKDPTFADFARELRGDQYAGEWRGNWAAALLYRPPGVVLAWLCHRLGIGPLAVTLAALALALVLPALAAWPALPLAPLCVLLAGALFQVLDCTDGTLARVTGCTSQTGADLDFFVDMGQWALLYLSLGILADRVLDDAWNWTAIAAFAAWGRLMARVVRDRLQTPGGSDPRPIGVRDYPSVFLGGISGLIPFLALSGDWLGVAVTALLVYSLLDIFEGLGPLLKRR